MRTILTRAAAAAAPLTVLLLPKCPLCIMPLLAAAGIVVPASPLLDAVAVAIVAGFTFLIVRAPSSHAVRGLAIAGALLMIAGRLIPFAAATWLGVGAMLVVASLRMRRPSRSECASVIPSARTARCAGEARIAKESS